MNTEIRSERMKLQLPHDAPRAPSVRGGPAAGHDPPRAGWIFVLAFCSVSGLSGSTLAESLVPPPKPAIAPLIAETYQNDADRDG